MIYDLIKIELWFMFFLNVCLKWFMGCEIFFSLFLFDEIVNKITIKTIYLKTIY